MALALYRKYRPRTFAEIIGQDHVTEPLSQALRSGRLHHAYLFSGPRGCGKTSSARILARSLNCEQGPTPEPCGVCASCKSLMNDGTGSIDVIEIDAASHGGVDDARDLREKAFFAPASSRYKIYVIDEAHMVSSAGFNALLKLVEEPPEYVKFIFATTEPEKVLGTIRSRTHHYPFRLIPPAVLRPYLQQLTEAEGVTVDPAVFPLVVRAGGGSARDTLSVLDQLIAGAGPDGVSYPRAVALLGVTDVALIDEMCDALAAGDGAAAYSTIDRVAEAGHDPRRFASDLLERFRDLIVLQQVPDAVTKGLIDGPADQLETMGAQATRLGPAQLSRSADIVHNGLVEMRGTTAPRLLLELITARMLLPGADDSHGALLQRLERMERRLTLSDFSEVRPNTATSSLPDASVDGGGRPTASVTGGAQVAASPPADPGSRAGISAARAAAAAAASRRAPAGGLSPGQRPPAPADAPPAPPSAAPASAPPPSPAPAATPQSAPDASQPGPTPSSPQQPAPSAEPPSGPTEPQSGSASRAAASSAPPASSGAPPSAAADSSVPAASSGAAPVSGGPAMGQPSSTGAYDDDEWPDEPPPWDEEPAPTSRPAAPTTRPAAPASRSVPPQAAPPSGGARRNQPQAAPTSAQPASRPDQPQAAPTSGGGQPASRPDQPQAAPTSGQPAHRPDPGAILPDAPDDGVEPVSSGAPGQLTAAAVREVWPEIIGVVGRQSKKLAALANGATVRDLDGQTVVLTFRFPAHAKMVADQPQLLVDALYEALGGRWQIRCEVSGETPGPAGGSQRGPAPATSQQSGPARNGSAENSPTSREQSSQPTRQRESAPQRTARSTPDDSDDWPEPAHLAPQPAADGTRPPHQAADPGQPAEGRQAADPSQPAQDRQAPARGQSAQAHPAADGWPETAQPATPVTAGADDGWPETARPATSAPVGVSPPAPASSDDDWPETARLGGPPAATASEQPTSADDTAWPEPARPGNPAPAQATPASLSPVGATSDASVSHPNAGPAAPPGSTAVPGRASAAPEAAAAPGRAAAPTERTPAERAPAERIPADAGRPAGRGLAAARAAAAAIANRQSSAAKPGAASKPGPAAEDGAPAEEAPRDPDLDGSPKSFDGFDPGDEPLDDVIDEKSARQNSEQQAMDLLREAFGAEKIGETQS